MGERPRCGEAEEELRDGLVFWETSMASIVASVNLLLCVFV